MKQSVIYQRIEGGAILAAGLVVYQTLHFSWVWFIVLFFVFDISITGYFINKRFGANTYNIVHNFVAPSLLLTIGLIAQHDAMIAFSIIWYSHVGFDRMIGFGLMLPTGFGKSNLGTISLKKKS